MKHALSLLALGFAVAFAGADDKEKKDAPPLVLNAEEKAVVELMNKEREKAGLKPLKVNSILCKVARGHSENMGKHDKMEHVLDGKTPGARAKDGGYEFAECGENVGMGIIGVKNQRDWKAADMMAWWMKSEAHRVNILHKEFTEIGIGVIDTKAGKRFYTQLFAAPLD